MLPPEFLDWWFEPWSYAPLALHPLAADRIGQRDGYRLWCEQAGLAADLPQDFDPSWQVAATGDANRLIAAARLFGGLIATRRHDESLLRQLSREERRWCASIAATQPLTAAELPYTERDDIALRGLVELARRVESGFPGLWPRLALLLPPELAGRSSELAAQAAGWQEGSATRAQRCWGLCSTQAARMQEYEPLAA